MRPVLARGLLALGILLLAAGAPSHASEAPAASGGRAPAADALRGLSDGSLDNLGKVKLVHQHFRHVQASTGRDPVDAPGEGRTPSEAQELGAAGAGASPALALRQRQALVGAGVPARQLRLFYVNASQPDGPLAIDLVLAYFPGGRGLPPLILDPRGHEPRPARPDDELTPMALSAMPGAWGEAPPLEIDAPQAMRRPSQSVQVRTVTTGVVRVPVSVVR